MSEELKPCPLCNYSARSGLARADYREHDHGWVECTSVTCGCSVSASSEAHAIATWNTRALPSPAAEPEDPTEAVIEAGDPRHPCAICSGRAKGAMHMRPCAPVTVAVALDAAIKREAVLRSARPDAGGE